MMQGAKAGPALVAAGIKLCRFSLLPRVVSRLIPPTFLHTVSTSQSATVVAENSLTD